MLAILSAENSFQETQVRGEITYVTSQSFYCDVGRNDGLVVGDSLSVFDNNILLGISIISNLSSTSSVCSLIPNVNLKKGNSIQATLFVEIFDAPITTATTDTITHIDSEKQVKTNITGSISFRYNQETIDNEIINNRSNGLFNVHAKSVLGLPISVSMYGKTNDLINDSTVNATIHQLSFKYADKLKKWDISAGRVYSPGLVGAGSVDGINISRKIKKMKIGVIGGFEESENKTKFGMFVNFGRLNNYIQYLNISETIVSDTINTLYSNLSTKIRPTKNINVSFSTRLNHPISNELNPLFSFANVYTEIRLFSWLRTLTYYNYGESVVTIDSTINQLTREYFGENVVIILPNKMRCSFNFTKLNLENAQNNINKYSIRVSKDNLLFNNFKGKVLVDVLSSLLYNSSRGKIGFTYSSKNWDTSINISQEIYTYGTGGDAYQKQTIDIELLKEWFNSIYTSIYIDYSAGDEGETIFGSFQISYRLKSF